MFKKYSTHDYSNLNNQHNILVLVGNGFDISILNKYNCGKLKGKTTSYSDFYDYISYFGLIDNSNILYRKMTDDRSRNKENWSDFENSIDELYENKMNGVSEIEKSLDEMQGLFTCFLNDIVDAKVLLKINNDSRSNNLAIQSLSKFLRDLHLFVGDFPSKTNHYDLFYYVFVNFNYTSLLDNYMYMDKTQFDPHYWPFADRNFQFFLDKKTDPSETTIWSSYVISNVVHPHGVQDIPRSLLFGIDRQEYDKGRSLEKRLIKSYWAEYDIKYKSYIDEAELFIIYGMSLGKTDGWWMDGIFDSILLRNAELIIYMYGTMNDEDVKNMFINACTRHIDSTQEDREKVKKKIFVVSFEKNDTYFLGFEKL